MRVLFALCAKDLLLLFRDRAGFFFTLGFPLLYGLFFGMVMASAFGGSGGSDSGGASAKIRIAVVDDDQSAESAAFLDDLRSSDDLELSLMTREEAEQAVRRGQRVALIALPPGFGEASRRLFWGDPARIDIVVDPSRSAESGMLQGIVMQKAFQGMQRRMGDSDSMRQSTDDALALLDADDPQQQQLSTFLSGLRTVMDTMPGSDGDGGAGGGFGDWQPVEVNVASITRASDEGASANDDPEPQNPYEISFPQAIVWAVMGAAAAFGISLVTERTQGTLTRLQAAPIAPSQVLLGKGGACFVTVIAAMLLLLTLAWIMGVRPALPHVIIAMLSIAICFVGIMMLLSVVGKTEAAAGGIGWAVLIVMAMLGGGMMPLFMLKGWMVTLSHISPVKWSILAMEGAIWRGFTLSEMVLPCGILIAIGILGFTVGSILFQRRTLAT